MAINLLSYLPTTMSSTLPKNPLGTQTTTPQTMGVTAKSPTINAPAPKTTLPTSQIAKPPVQPVVSAPIAPVQPVAKTPAQMAAGNTSGTGAGSLDPTASQSQNTTSTNGTTPVYSETNPVTYSGLVQQAANVASQPSADYTKQQEQANAYNEALKQSRINEAGGLAANAQNPIPLEFQQGRGQVLQTQYAQEQAALGSAYQGASNLQQAANTQQGLQQTGLLGAASAAAPQMAGFNQQPYNPLTNTFGTNGQTGGATAMSQLPAQGQTAVQSYAQQVQNGSMTRADAESRLSAYGQPGLNALNEALGSGFNTNASNASAGTTQQGQQLQTQAASATQALDTLQQKFNSLNQMQTGGIPATNSIANWIAGALGDASLTEYNQTLHDARQQLQGVLAAAGGGTPTGYESTAQTYLPDNMTPAQLTQGIANVKALIQQKVGSFTSSGQQTNQNGSSNSSNIYSW